MNPWSEPPRVPSSLAARGQGRSRCGQAWLEGSRASVQLAAALPFSGSRTRGPRMPGMGGHRTAGESEVCLKRSCRMGGGPVKRILPDRPPRPGTTLGMQLLILVSNSEACLLTDAAGGPGRGSIIALGWEVTATPKRGDPCPESWRPPLNKR